MLRAAYRAGDREGGSRPRQLHCTQRADALGEEALSSVARRRRTAPAATKTMRGPGILHAVGFLMNWLGSSEFLRRESRGFSPPAKSIPKLAWVVCLAFLLTRRASRNLCVRFGAPHAYYSSRVVATQGSQSFVRGASLLVTSRSGHGTRCTVRGLPGSSRLSRSPSWQPLRRNCYATAFERRFYASMEERPTKKNAVATTWNTPKKKPVADGTAVPRTVNGTGHTGPSEFCATSI